MSVPLTNLDRVLWPRTGFTKGDLVAYYRAVAPALLPHLERRPLTLWRFPSGVHRRGWWQNECRGAPEWLAVAELRGQRFCVVEDERGLTWVANQGTVELHPFPVRLDRRASSRRASSSTSIPARRLGCSTRARWQSRRGRSSARPQR